MEPTVELVKLVARLFYEDRHAVFLDYLLRERMLPDDVLADRMQVLLRDVGKIAARLREDRLIMTHIRPEVREYDGKTFSRTYYYIDFALFADVVRYRLYMMRVILEQKVKNESNDRRYFCERCRKTYTSLDAFSLVNLATGNFECELCGSELQVQDSTVTGVAAGNAQARLNEQTIRIQRLFKKLEETIIPPFDPIEYLKSREAFELAASPSSSAEEVAGLRVAGSDPVKSPEASIQVEIASEGERERRGKPVYEMPVWHTHSTITGQQVKGEQPASGSAMFSASTTLPHAKSVEVASLEYQRFYEASQSVLAASAGSLPNHHLAKRSKSEETVSRVAGPGGDEPSSAELFVSVQGVAKRLEEITDDDKNNMTEEEYQKYYEAYMSQ